MDIPILMSKPMIHGLQREIEAPGTGKTETRRIIKPQPDDNRRPLMSVAYGRKEYSWGNHRKDNGDLIWFQPRWQEGDRLWVREGWSLVGNFDPGLYITRADYPACVPRGYENLPPESGIRWRPSIHMPRARSRFTLVVTNVRVQRLHDITEEEARLEGCGLPYLGDGDAPFEEQATMISSRMQYRNLWNSLNAERPWDANPWVVAITFIPHGRNVRDMQ